MIFPYILLATSLIYGILYPFYMLQYLTYIVVFGALMQSYYYMKERNSDCIYGVLYSLFWFTCLWWVVPYSILTANNGSWMTRTLPTAAAPSPTLADPALPEFAPSERRAA